MDSRGREQSFAEAICLMMTFPLIQRSVGSYCVWQKTLFKKPRFPQAVTETILRLTSPAKTRPTVYLFYCLTNDA